MLRFLFPLLVLGFLLTRLEAEDLLHFRDTWKDRLFSDDAWLFVPFLLLWALNLVWDVLAWRQTLPLPLRGSFGQLLITQLESLAWGFVTPVSLGEYAGRARRHTKDNRADALAATSRLKLARVLTRQIWGSTALLLLYLLQAPLPPGPWWLVPAGAAVFFPALLLILQRYPVRSHKLPFIGSLFPEPEAWKRRALAPILFFTSLKFWGYTGQYALLLYLLQPESMLNGWLLAMAFYLLSAWIPVYGLFDGLLKGGLAALWFGAADYNPLEAGLTAFTLWLTNLAIPAAAGGVLHWFSSPASPRSAPPGSSH